MAFKGILQGVLALGALTGGYVGLVEAPDRRPSQEQVADRFVQAYFSNDFATLNEVASKRIVDGARADTALGAIVGGVSVTVSPISVKIPVLNFVGVTRLNTTTLEPGDTVLVQGRYKGNLGGAQFTEEFAVAVKIRCGQSGRVYVDTLYDVAPSGEQAWRLREHKDTLQQLQDIQAHGLLGRH